MVSNHGDRFESSRRLYLRYLRVYFFVFLAGFFAAGFLAAGFFLAAVFFAGILPSNRACLAGR